MAPNWSSSTSSMSRPSSRRSPRSAGGGAISWPFSTTRTIARSAPGTKSRSAARRVRRRPRLRRLARRGLPRGAGRTASLDLPRGGRHDGLSSARGRARRRRRLDRQLGRRGAVARDPVIPDRWREAASGVAIQGAWRALPGTRASRDRRGQDRVRRLDRELSRPGSLRPSAGTLHIPRGPYLGRLAGIPTIRPFEALACGIPLIMMPWEDREGLFDAGRD